MEFKLSLTKKEKLSKDIYGFWFRSEKGKIDFKAGQFLEWTLDHKNPDSRGVKRFFTISSSPSEDEVLLTTKIIEKPSSFKKTLKSLNPGDIILAKGPYGEFILPEDKKKSLAFIAGGIGVTPFRSIVKYLIDTNESRDIILFYGANLKEEIVFQDIFEEAKERFNLKVIYSLKEAPENWKGERGYIDGDMVKRNMEDIKKFIFYVSGPEPMVHATSKELMRVKVRGKRIKHDYFPGYDGI